jgi:hypothetical protein
MVVRNQDADTHGLSRCHALNAGNTVIDRDDEIGHLRSRHLDNLGRKPIAKLKAIGDQVAHLAKPHLLQDRDRHSRAGGAIRVKISDNEYSGLTLYGISQ